MLVFGPAARASYVAVFVDEVKVLVIPFDRVGHENLGLAFAGLRLVADIALSVEIIKIIAVIALKIKLFNLFRHMPFLAML